MGMPSIAVCSGIGLKRRLEVPERSYAGILEKSKIVMSWPSQVSGDRSSL